MLTIQAGKETPHAEIYNDVIELNDSEEAEPEFNHGTYIGGKHARQALKEIEEVLTYIKQERGSDD